MHDDTPTQSAMTISIGNQNRKLHKSRLWDICKIMLAILLIVFVFSKTSLDELYQLFRQISWIWMLGFLIAFYMSTVLMAHRYWLLIGKKTTFMQALNLVIIQAVVGNMIATSAGMASYVMILRSRYRVQIAQSLASLIVARISDLFVLLLMLVISSRLVWPQITSLRWLVLILVIGILFIMLTFFSVFIFRRRVVGIIDWILEVSRFSRFKPIKKVSNLLSNLAEQDTASMKTMVVPILCSSLLIFMCMVISSYCNVQVFAIPIGIQQIMFMVIITQLLGIIPIQVFGGLGVLDVTAMYIYGMFGIGQATIAPVIVGSRIIFYAVNLILLLYISLDTLFNRHTAKQIADEEAA